MKAFIMSDVSRIMKAVKTEFIVKLAVRNEVVRELNGIKPHSYRISFKRLSSKLHAKIFIYRYLGY